MLIIVFCVRMHKRAKSKLLLLVEKDRTQWNLVGEPGLMFVPFVPRVFPEADSVLGCFSSVPQEMPEPEAISTYKQRCASGLARGTGIGTDGRTCTQNQLQCLFPASTSAIVKDKSRLSRYLVGEGID